LSLTTTPKLNNLNVGPAKEEQHPKESESDCELDIKDTPSVAKVQTTDLQSHKTSSGTLTASAASEFTFNG